MQCCDFGGNNTHKFYSKNNAMKKCSGELKKLIDFTDEINDVVGWKVIQQRSGIFIDGEICLGHIQFYGRGFERGFAGKQNNCKFPNCGRSIKELSKRQLWEISYDASKQLLANHHMFIPFGIRVCPECGNWISENKDKPSDPPAYEEVESTSTQPLGLDMLRPSSPSLVDEDSDVDFDPEGQENIGEDKEEEDLEYQDAQEYEDLIKQQRKLMKQMLEFQGIPDSRIPRAKVPLNGLDASTKSRIKRIMSESVALITSCLTDLQEDRLNIWKYCNDSGCLEMGMRDEAMASTITETLIHAFNNAPRGSEEVRILSTLVPRYPKYSQIRQFNPPDLDDTEDDDEENEFFFTEVLSEDEQLAIPKDVELCFKRKVSRNLWNQARIHYYSNG